MVYIVLLLKMLISVAAATCTTRNIAQYCINCRASSDCVDTVQTNYPSDSEACADRCLNSECSMGQLDATDRCTIYPSCTVVKVDSSGYTTMRKTCRPDCLQAEITYHTKRMALCAGVTGNVVIHLETEIESEDSCLSLCLDWTGCTGVTYIPFDKICQLHDCNFIVASSNTHFIELLCTGSINTTQTSMLVSGAQSEVTTTTPDLKTTADSSGSSLKWSKLTTGTSTRSITTPASTAALFSLTSSTETTKKTTQVSDSALPLDTTLLHISLVAEIAEPGLRTAQSSLPDVPSSNPLGSGPNVSGLLLQSSTAQAQIHLPLSQGRNTSEGFFKSAVNTTIVVVSSVCGIMLCGAIGYTLLVSRTGIHPSMPSQRVQPIGEEY